MGLLGEMVPEVIRRESDLPSQTRSSGCIPLEFISITLERNLDILERNRRPDISYNTMVCFFHSDSC